MLQACAYASSDGQRMLGLPLTTPCLPRTRLHLPTVAFLTTAPHLNYLNHHPQRRGGLVIQQLSQKLGGLRVYRELSRLLQVRSVGMLVPGAEPEAMSTLLCWLLLPKSRQGACLL